MIAKGAVTELGIVFAQVSLFRTRSWQNTKLRLRPNQQIDLFCDCDCHCGYLEFPVVKNFERLYRRPRYWILRPKPRPSCDDSQVIGDRVEAGVVPGITGRDIKCDLWSSSLDQTWTKSRLEKELNIAQHSSVQPGQDLIGIPKLDRKVFRGGAGRSREQNPQGGAGQDNSQTRGIFRPG